MFSWVWIWNNNSGFGSGSRQSSGTMRIRIHNKAFWKFTVMPAGTIELSQPIQTTSDSQPTNGNCQNIPDYSCPKLGASRRYWPLPPTPKLTTEGGRRQGGGVGRSRVVTWRRRVDRELYWDPYRRQMWTSGVVPEAWQHWLYKPSSQETAVEVEWVHPEKSSNRIFYSPALNQQSRLSKWLIVFCTVLYC